LAATHQGAGNRGAPKPQNVNGLFTVTGKKLGVDEEPSPVSTRR